MRKRTNLFLLYKKYYRLYMQQRHKNRELTKEIEMLKEVNQKQLQAIIAVQPNLARLNQIQSAIKLLKSL